MGNSSRITEKSSQKSGQTGGQTSGQSLPQRARELLVLIKKNPFATREELSAALHISPSAVQKHIEKLKKGYIRRSGGDFGGHWEILEGERSTAIAYAHKQLHSIEADAELREQMQRLKYTGVICSHIAERVSICHDNAIDKTLRQRKAEIIPHPHHLIP